MPLHLRLRLLLPALTLAWPLAPAWASLPP